MAEEKALLNDDVDRRSLYSYQECLTMPPMRDFYLPVNKDFSHPLKPAGLGRTLEKMWDEKRGLHSKHYKKKAVLENTAVFELNSSIVHSSSLKSQMARLNRHVELGLKAAEDDLESKRNKLKASILTEQVALTREYVEKSQKMADVVYEEKKKLAEDIVKRQKLEKELESKEKKELQERENSQELRTFYSKSMRLEAAEVQKYQICEKLKQKDREEDFEKFWLDITNKQREARILYEEDLEKIRVAKIREQKEVLDLQIKEKILMKDKIKAVRENEAAFIDKLKERIEEEDYNEWKLKLEKQMELQKTMNSQLKEERKIKDEKLQHEKRYDAYYISMLNEMIRKDMVAQTDTRQQNKREAELFKRQLVEMKAANAAEEKRIEELRAIEVQKKEAVIDQNMKIAKEARCKLERETLETRKQQIIQKKQVLEAEREAEKLNTQWSQFMLNKNIELDKLKEENSKTERYHIVNEHNEQLKYEKLQRQRQLLKEDEYFAKQKEIEKAKDDITNFKTSNRPLHPFTAALKKRGH